MSKTPENPDMKKEKEKTQACECPQEKPTLDELLDTGRRGFLTQAGTVILGAAAICPAVAAAASTSLNPIRGLFKHTASCGSGCGKSAENTHTSGTGKSYRVGTLDQLAENGAPMKFSIIDDMPDGWALKKDVSVGAVWVQRLSGRELRVFQALCPHAGCPIMYDDNMKRFHCPCHDAFFQLDGVRAPEPSPSPSPRDMDTLEATVAEDGAIMVAFQRFKEGTPLKIAEG